MSHPSAPPPARDIIVIGASVGGIECMKALLPALPRDLPAALCFVQHIGAHGPGLLPQILQGVTSLVVSSARDGDTLRHGHLYVAPPDRHLLVEAPDRVRVTHGPKENRTRPAIDPLFRSAAADFGPRVIGIVLSGHLDDGTAGLWAIKDQGGTSIVQHPDDALAPSMPASALKQVEIDHCVPLREIAPLLVSLTGTAAALKGGKPVSNPIQTDIKIAKEGAAEGEILTWGKPSIYACPDCHGVLMQLKEGPGVRFRCHTGHAYSMESLLADFEDKTEATLFSALRSLQEKVQLLREMAGHLSDQANPEGAAALRAKAQEAEGQAEVVRQLLLGSGASST